MTAETIEGRVTVSVRNHGDGERIITLGLTGLPGWVLGLIRDVAPFYQAGATYSGNHHDGSGPDHVSLSAGLPFVVQKASLQASAAPAETAKVEKP